MSAIFFLVGLLTALQIEAGEAFRQNMDFCFYLDGSSTVCGGNEPCDNWKSILQFSKNITNTFDIGPTKDRVALVTGFNGVEVEWDLRRYTSKNPLISAIGRVQFKGGVFTDLNSTQLLFSKIFNPASGDNVFSKNVILFISDGAPDVSEAAAAAASKAIQEHGATVCVVCVLPGCIESWAKAIASPPEKDFHQTYFLVESYSLLYSVLDNVLVQINNLLVG